MSRRLSHRLENILPQSDTIENGDNLQKKPRRSTKPTRRKTEEDEENQPTTDPRVEYEIIKSEDESAEEKAPVPRKINSVKGKATLAKKEKPVAGSKRKAKPEEGEEDESAVSAKPTKKRKTKEEKAAEAMPAAERTAVSTLGKALYIGAHVSAAKGMMMTTIRSPHPNSRVLGRCPKFNHEFLEHRWQFLCSVPQIPTKMDQSSSCSRGKGPIQGVLSGKQI